MSQHYALSSYALTCALLTFAPGGRHGHRLGHRPGAHGGEDVPRLNGRRRRPVRGVSAMAQGHGRLPLGSTPQSQPLVSGIGEAGKVSASSPRDVDETLQAARGWSVACFKY